MQGWISLHRQIVEWEWYNEPNTFRLFIHLLLKANHKPKKWKGKTIEAGELVTGRKQLANEITIKTTNKYSLISINNWSKYQATNQQTNKRSTSNQPHLKNVYKNVYKNKVNFDEFGNSFSVRESDKQIKPLKELLK